MQRYRTLVEFYPFYLGEHSNRTCRRLHFAGSTIAVGLLVAATSGDIPGQEAAFSQRNAMLQVAIAQKMQAGMSACAGHPSVMAALRAFPGE